MIVLPYGRGQAFKGNENVNAKTDTYGVGNGYMGVTATLEITVRYGGNFLWASIHG